MTGVKTLLPEPPPAGVKNCPGNRAPEISRPARTARRPTGITCRSTTHAWEKMGDTPARFLALDLYTQEFAWDIRTRVPQSSGAAHDCGRSGVFGDAGSLLPRVR